MLTPAGSPPFVADNGHTAIYDQALDRMVLFGGTNYSGHALNNAWELVWNPPVSVPGDTDGGLRRDFDLAVPRPNPARGETFVDFKLGAPARVVLDVFDTHGRQVKRIADEWFAAGRHTRPWRGDDEGGKALGSGVYFIRIKTGGFQATQRAVLIRR